jgi:cobalt-zinc-cadmium efflux system protein
VLGLLILVESVRRVIDPPEVEGLPVLLVALAGVAVNVAAAWMLARADRRSLNVEGAFQHVLTDLYAFIATAVAGVLILTTGFREADGLAALFVSATMLRAAYGLLKASGRIFLEAAPAGLDPGEIGRAMAAHPGVAEVHDLHVWEVTSGFPALSAHVLVGSGADWHGVRIALARLLEEDFGISHSTIQVDRAGDDLLEIAPL